MTYRTDPKSSMAEKHSLLGIASFSISVAVGSLVLVLFVVAGLLNARRIEESDTYPGQAVVGLIAIVLLAGDVIALGLGVAAVSQSTKKRMFGILGLVFSSVTLLGTIGLIVIGLAYSGRFAN